jgi:hypothetical protein
MLLCDGCDEGLPCGALACEDGARLPVTGSARVAPPPPPAHTLPLLAARPQREGPWRLRYSRDRYLLLLFGPGFEAAPAGAPPLAPRC